MPKIVDHAERRRHIAGALRAVIREQGLPAVSVRTVAARAGISVGALRHYFDSQDALLAFAAEDLLASVGERVRARLATATSVEDLREVLEEAVPLDAERQADFAVWLELIVHSRTEPALAALSQQFHLGLRSLCSSVVSALHLPTVESQTAVHTLHALLDGVSLHLALYPEHTSPTVVRDMLQATLSGMLTGPAG